MNSDEAEKAINALYKLCMSLAGQLSAQKTISDALIAAIGVDLPPIAEKLMTHIDGLAPYSRDSLEADSVMAFENGINTAKRNIQALLRG